MYLIRTDYIPWLHDMGLDATIRSLLGRRTDIQQLAAQIENATHLGITDEILLEYLADRKLAGAFADVEVEGGALPEGAKRPSAITGIGQDEGTLWFSTPNIEARVIRWYKNGSLICDKLQDCKDDRSISKDILGCKPGDIIQVCEVVDGVVGWWARIEVE